LLQSIAVEVVDGSDVLLFRVDHSALGRYSARPGTHWEEGAAVVVDLLQCIYGTTFAVFVGILM
jgi:hypothetical protein